MKKILLLLVMSCMVTAGCGQKATDESGEVSSNGGSPSEGAVKIGILHSLSGTMAISETSLRDVVLMAVEEINWASKSSRLQLTLPVIGTYLPKRQRT